MEASDFLSVQNNKVILATCNLNQWALDFDGNLHRTMESIRIAKSRGARYRLGPELELSGYSCEDHFLEMDTFMHSEQSLAAILDSEVTNDILCDIGCPILHNNVRYNCRIFCLNKKIVFIRPKAYLADDGNYRERRYFSTWDIENKILQDHPLSDLLRKVTGQTTVPMGIGILATEESTIASEICEELWAARSPHINFFLSGVDIVSNGSGSHHELRKLDSRLQLMKNATRKCGGVYVYANHRGCDGTRLYFDGSSLICMNGDLLAQASQFSLQDVEVITATVDLDTVRSFRGNAASLQEQSSRTDAYPSIDIRHFSLRDAKSTGHDIHTILPESEIKQSRIHTPEEECCKGPACWLWDYMRRSGAAGFLLPLSGGADSAAVAAIVHVMCTMVAEAVLAGNQQVIDDVKRIFMLNHASSSLLEEASPNSKSYIRNHLLKDSFEVQDVTVGNEVDQEKVKLFAKEISYQVLHTIYMGTTNSSWNTQDRAKRLANSIHCYHNTLFIDEVVASVLKIFSLLTGKTPRYLVQGGTMPEDLALQNIQARIRMVMAYLCAQLFPWLRGNTGFLLVLGSANVDEALRGYMTKYDCSSADLNPIGGISKVDLKKMLLWISEHHQVEVLKEIATAQPTAELRPMAEGSDGKDSNQLDEEDMGMTYAELSVYGKLRKISKCGPVKMFVKLLDTWKHLTATEIAGKVKKFFFFYSINRHKMTTLTPSYHAEGYSPDDNRFDLRPFLYNAKWTRQFATIDSIVASHSKKSK